MSQPPDLRKLPDAVADFETIRNPARNYVFADKTKILHRLLENPDTPYFLSRPRRFGKSLLVSTLEAALRGRRDLFEARLDKDTGRSVGGLWLAGPESGYHFRSGPVISLSLASAASASVEELKNSLRAKLDSVALGEDLELKQAEPPDRFAELMQKLSMKHGGKRVAVLVDEYDAPILDELAKPKLAAEIRDALAKFYAALKDSEGLRGFTFITGVTKFAQASLFSKLNNLEDLTLKDGCAAICGLTVEEDFDAMFGDRLDAAAERLRSKGVLAPGQTRDDLRGMILKKYDGYSWDGRTRVLNPWSLLKFFDRLIFADYWASSGSPGFLIELIKRSHVSLDCFKANNYFDSEINAVDVGYFHPPSGSGRWNPTILMFQTGYLTVSGSAETADGITFGLKIPNTEVQNSIIKFLMPFAEAEKAAEINKRCRTQAEAMAASLSNLDPRGFEAAFSSLLASIPHQIHLPCEACCHTALVFALLLAGQPYYAEESTGDGRADVSLMTAAGNVHVVEIKHRQPPKAKNGGKPPAEDMAGKALQAMIGEAMGQIDKKKYVLPHQGSGAPVYKTALAVCGRTCVRVEFAKADNWTLEETDEGPRVVTRPGG